ncbi:MAG: hypothetical protein ACOZF2_01635 [Thermodesulfobacteriota bacterium]
MAKKKKFAGKKTKLAELPLTRILEQKAENEATWIELQTSGATGTRQLILSLERTADDSAGLLAATYYQVLQELRGLQADLKTDTPSLPATPAPLPPPALALPRNLKQALLLAREGLEELHRLLSK